MSSTKIELYGTPFSQPSRAVYWLCLINDVPVEYKNVNLAKGEHLKPEFVKINPQKKVPAISDEGYFVYESHTIMRYISTKFKLEQYYPLDLKKRTEIDTYLDWHHTNTRYGAAGLVFNTLFAAQLRKNSIVDEKRMKEFETTLNRSLKSIDQVFLKDGKYIGGLENPSIADLSCYSELASLNMIGFDWFSNYKNILEWKSRMEKLQHYETVHRALKKVSKL